MVNVLSSDLTSASPARQPDPLTVTTSRLAVGSSSAAPVGERADRATSAAAAVLSMRNLSEGSVAAAAPDGSDEIPPLPDGCLTIHGLNGRSSSSTPGRTITQVDSGTSCQAPTRSPSG